MITFVGRCEHDGCSRVIYLGKGSDGTLCWNHFRQLQKLRQEATEGKVHYVAQCEYGKGRVQCTNPARAGGLCTKHYQRDRRTRMAQEREEAKGLD